MEKKTISCVCFACADGGLLYSSMDEMSKQGSESIHAWLSEKGGGNIVVVYYSGNNNELLHHLKMHF